jgi:crotonobetainyl-CoA:carnitine CoA-transferase CaiB-like acyl-CoA transferase
MTGQIAMPAGNRDVCVSPADTFRCRDNRFVAIAAAMPKEFQGLCKAMGRPKLAEDPKFRDHLTRLRDENTLELLKIIEKWARKKTPEEIERLAEEFGFAATRILSVKDIVDDKHCRERGFMAYVDDPMIGPFYEYEFPVMMSKTPPKVKWSVRAIGFDNEYIMTHKLGKNKQQIQKYYECGALGKWADLISRRPPSDWDGKSGIIMAREEAKTAERGE